MITYDNVFNIWCCSRFTALTTFKVDLQRGWSFMNLPHFGYVRVGQIHADHLMKYTPEGTPALDKKYEIWNAGHGVQTATLECSGKSQQENLNTWKYRPNNRYLDSTGQSRSRDWRLLLRRNRWSKIACKQLMLGVTERFESRKRSRSQGAWSGALSEEDLDWWKGKSQHNGQVKLCMTQVLIDRFHYLFANLIGWIYPRAEIFPQ